MQVQQTITKEGQIINDSIEMTQQSRKGEALYGKKAGGRFGNLGFMT